MILAERIAVGFLATAMKIIFRAAPRFAEVSMLLSSPNVRADEPSCV
jgi:hypothetical protein